MIFPVNIVFTIVIHVLTFGVEPEYSVILYMLMC